MSHTKVTTAESENTSDRPGTSVPALPPLAEQAERLSGVLHSGVAARWPASS